MAPEVYVGIDQRALFPYTAFHVNLLRLLFPIVEK